MTSAGEEHARELQEVMKQVGPASRKLQQDLSVGVMGRAEGGDD